MKTIIAQLDRVRPDHDVIGVSFRMSHSLVWLSDIPYIEINVKCENGLYCKIFYYYFIFTVITKCHENVHCNHVHVCCKRGLFVFSALFGCFPSFHSLIFKATGGRCYTLRITNKWWAYRFNCCLTFQVYMCPVLLNKVNYVNVRLTYGSRFGSREDEQVLFKWVNACAVLCKLFCIKSSAKWINVNVIWSWLDTGLWTAIGYHSHSDTARVC